MPLLPPAGSTAITAYVSVLTTLQKLNLQVHPMPASAALMHLQQLTRLTSLQLYQEEEGEEKVQSDVLAFNSSWGLDFSVESCQVCFGMPMQ